jgi:uncharacterized damage-inducible protein DinB
MTGPLLDAFRHHSWATLTLLEFCRSLNEEQRAATLPGVYGNISATLKHILGAEAFYRSLFGGSFPDWDWRDEEPQPLEDLLVWTREMAAFWEQLLAAPPDADAPLLRRRSDGRVQEMRAGVMLAQALHHGNVHREQVCAILTALGLQPPDLSAYAYGYESGRMERP